MRDKVLPHPFANQVLYNRFNAVLRRLPELHQGGIRQQVKVTVVSDSEMEETVGHGRNLAQALSLRSGDFRLLLRAGLAHIPGAVTDYIIAHELAHWAVGLDENAADMQVVAWGFEPEMRQARSWGILMQVSLSGFIYQPTPTMAAL